jgi:hypothetical protein
VTRRERSAGTAWLVADQARHDFLCFLFGGPSDGRLRESTRQPTAPAAVAWGRSRTPRVRIRTPSGRTFWAGTAPKPDGISFTWVDGEDVDRP